MGDYNNAVLNLNKILNSPVYNVRIDLHCSAWILQLITHYELGNIDFVRYKIKYVKKFLAKRKQLYQSETILLDFFKKKLLKTNTKKTLTKSFKALLIQMKALLKNPIEQKGFDYFDFISWIESKIKNKTFGEVVRGKVVKKARRKQEAGSRK